MSDVRLTRYVHVASAILAVLCIVPLAHPDSSLRRDGHGRRGAVEAGMLLVCAIGLLLGASRLFQVQTAIGVGLLALTLPALPSVTDTAWAPPRTGPGR